jgi:FixJ family two-component response regulator
MEAVNSPESQKKLTPIIHLVDDDESFQTAIARLLRAAGYEVRGYANAGDFLLSHFDDGPGCILMDIRMPGPSGLELQAALTTRPEPLPVIFLTGHGDIPATVRAFKAIQAALTRDSENRILRQQLKNWRACYDSLTARELQVFERVVAGRMNKEIAGELGAAERTIKAHRAQMMDKMGATSIAQLVHIADLLHANRKVPPTAPPPA